jgi:predicted short-subunit dehydrogenase-like oxidoreductase (DUF2520 family)
MILHKISFAGAGRVAGALCQEIYSAGNSIELIVSESEINGSPLADSCNASWSPVPHFPDTSDIIIVSVPDHRLKSVLEKLVCRTDALVVHTAGSIGLDVFPDKFMHKGILYPLQTFSLMRKVDFLDLPFFLESSDKKSDIVLENLVRSIGGKVYFSDNEHRTALHLAAVFVCNFTNHMLTLGKEIALDSGFEFEVLIPLIKETISKAIDIGPEESQTGPAVRKDYNTIEKHQELLFLSPDVQRIYDEMTRSIIEHHKNM